VFIRVAWVGVGVLQVFIECPCSLFRCSLGVDRFSLGCYRCSLGYYRFTLGVYRRSFVCFIGLP